MLENGGGGRGFAVDGEVGEEAAIGLGEGAGDEVEGGEGDERVAEAAETVDEDTLDGFGHVALASVLGLELWLQPMWLVESVCG